jgi:hypothetical protein
MQHGEKEEVDVYARSGGGEKAPQSDAAAPNLSCTDDTTTAHEAAVP